jgi:hypothetical protein
MKTTGRLRPLKCSTTSPSPSIAPAGEQLAHLLADGYVSEGTAGFAFAMFPTCWAWINFSRLASSFDTNDWLYRVMTMVQTVGVVVMALGLPAMFHSLPTGGHLDIRIMAAGYVVLRFDMVAQWLRAPARPSTGTSDPPGSCAPTAKSSFLGGRQAVRSTLRHNC